MYLLTLLLAVVSLGRSYSFGTAGLNTSSWAALGEALSRWWRCPPPSFKHSFYLHAVLETASKPARRTVGDTAGASARTLLGPPRPALTSNGLLHPFSCVQFVSKEPHVIALNLGHAGAKSVSRVRVTSWRCLCSLKGMRSTPATTASRAEKADSGPFRTSTNIYVELKLPFDEENCG